MIHVGRKVILTRPIANGRVESYNNSRESEIVGNKSQAVYFLRMAHQKSMNETTYHCGAIVLV